MSKRKTFLVGTLVGGIIGSVTALLFAPKAGKELRSDIADSYNQAAEKTREVAGNVSQKTQSIAKEISTTASEWVDRSKQAVSQAAEEVRSWRRSGQDSESEVAVTRAEELSDEEQSN
ncbi:YtxH domain-containing protein [Paenibacillus gansuensis]|uniref:YtxH domain-containing protein n=1 Tax=Paenibacillus gansuensis TaxID=306542 RepID=A0ABW5PFM1_9BACL